MSARELYYLSLKCTKCGTVGEAGMSEWDRPTEHEAHGRHIRSLSGGFVEIRSDEQGWPWIECVKCRVRITY